MQKYPEALEELIAALKKLPGVGQMTSERLAFHLLKEGKTPSEALAKSIVDAALKVRHCSRCFNVTANEGECDICLDEERDPTIVCVVESPRELLALEKNVGFPGRYHCLLGRLQPSDGVGEDDLTIDALVKRVRREKVEEVILATNPDLGGDATAMAVARALQGSDVRVTRLGRGVPVGFQLELLSGNVLQEALNARQPVSRD